MLQARKKELSALHDEFMKRLRRCSEEVWSRLQETYPDASGPVRRSDGTNDLEDINESLIIGDLHRCDTECRQLVTAIRRIDRGKYGVCATCGDEIPEKRLRAVPAAANCLNCQARAEAEAEDHIRRSHFPSPSIRL